MYVRKIPEYLDILRKITHFIDNRSDVCVESCTKVDTLWGFEGLFDVEGRFLRDQCILKEPNAGA